MNDYQAIARIINKAQNHDKVNNRGAVIFISRRLADYFSKIDPKFNQDKFLTNCIFGVKEIE